MDLRLVLFFALTTLWSCSSGDHNTEPDPQPSNEYIATDSVPPNDSLSCYSNEQVFYNAVGFWSKSWETFMINFKPGYDPETAPLGTKVPWWKINKLKHRAPEGGPQGVRIYMGCENCDGSQPVIPHLFIINLDGCNDYFAENFEKPVLKCNPINGETHFVTAEEAAGWTTAWQAHQVAFAEAEPWNLPVYAFNYSWPIIDDLQTMASDTLDSIMIEFGLHTVSPDDPDYAFPVTGNGNPEDCQLATNGYMIMDLILRAPQNPEKCSVVDFATPCPRLCNWGQASILLNPPQD